VGAEDDADMSGLPPSSSAVAGGVAAVAAAPHALVTKDDSDVGSSAIVHGWAKVGRLRRMRWRARVMLCDAQVSTDATVALCANGSLR